MENIAAAMDVMTATAIIKVDTKFSMDLGRGSLVVIEECDIDDLDAKKGQQQQYFQITLHRSRSAKFGESCPPCIVGRCARYT